MKLMWNEILKSVNEIKMNQQQQEQETLTPSHSCVYPD